MRQLLVGDPHPAVGHLEPRLVVMAPDSSHDVTALGRVLDGVRDQVLRDLGEAPPVPVDDNRSVRFLAKLDVLGLGARLR